MNKLSIFAIFFLMFGYANANKEVAPASKHNTVNIYHGEKYIDKFGWIRDKNFPTVDDPEIINFLNNESANTETFFEKHRKLVDTVFEEIKTRSPAHNQLLTEDEHYYYSSEYIDNAKYLTHHYINKKTGSKKVLLDERERSFEKNYYHLMHLKVSPDGLYVAWIEDVIGHEDGMIFIKELSNGQIIKVCASKSGDILEWDNDSKAIYYIKKDVKGRDFQIINKKIVKPMKESVVYEESDEAFNVEIKYSLSREKLFISSDNWTSRETHSLIKNDNGYQTELLISRNLKSVHKLEFIDGDYYAYTNSFNENFDLVKIPKTAETAKEWIKINNNTADTFLKDIIFFQDYFVILERKNGIDELLIIERKTGKEHHIDFGERIIGLTFHKITQNHLSNVLRIRVESNLTPRTIYDYNMANKSLKAISETTIKGYDKSNYIQERLNIKSTDGTKVPVTLVYNKMYRPSKKYPLYLYVYGAYGEGIPPEFPKFAMSAIDRGFTYAIAHVRGGDELGKEWHSQGKLQNKKNTFDDFISVSEFLVKKGYVAKGNISVSGESAAGTTIGYAINEKPELYKSVSVLVPFVDVLNSLMDSTLEYTMTDWTEFGNPVESKSVFDYIKSYSPYDNIKKQAYPNIYVTGGIKDPAVGYWEPAKWVSKIRDNQTNKSLSLLNVRTGGHIDTGNHTVDYEFAKQITFLLVTNNRVNIKDNNVNEN